MSARPRRVTLTRRALLGSGALAAAACGAATRRRGAGDDQPSQAAGGATGGPVTLTYLNWFSASDPQHRVFAHALGVLQGTYPALQVRQTTTAVPTAEPYLTQAAAGSPPDIAAPPQLLVDTLRSRGLLGDLTPYVKRDAKSFRPDDFVEATLARAVRQGQWHAVPLQTGLWFLLYNVGAFERSGVSRPDATWTWDRLRDAVATIKRRDAGVPMVATPTGGEAPTPIPGRTVSSDPRPDAGVVGMPMPPYELLVRANGGEILSADEKRCVLDRPEAIEAVQWLADLRHRQRVVPQPDEVEGQAITELFYVHPASLALFGTGRYVALIVDTPHLASLQPATSGFRWDVATVPRGKAVRVSTLKGPNLVMSAESKEQDAAWTFLSCYAGIEMQRFAATEGRLLGARKSALQRYPDVKDGYDKQAILDTIAFARPLPDFGNLNAVAAVVMAGLDAAFTGRRTAQSAMTETARLVNAILARG